MNPWNIDLAPNRFCYPTTLFPVIFRNCGRSETMKWHKVWPLGRCRWTQIWSQKVNWLILPANTWKPSRCVTWSTDWLKPTVFPVMYVPIDITLWMNVNQQLFILSGCCCSVAHNLLGVQFSVIGTDNQMCTVFDSKRNGKYHFWSRKWRMQNCWSRKSNSNSQQRQVQQQKLKLSWRKNKSRTKKRFVLNRNAAHLAVVTVNDLCKCWKQPHYRCVSFAEEKAKGGLCGWRESPE